MKQITGFFSGCARLLLFGHRHYGIWMTVLMVLSLLGLNAYCRQLAFGLATTGMGDEVSWGAYIGNFTFLVGMAAAAVMMVIPAYLFKDEGMKKVVVVSELFAVSAVVMCILFILVDLGRPDRLWHLIPTLGVFNWPRSMLTWDMIALNVYLLLNLYVCLYVLFKTYRKESPTPALYLPVVFLAILWAPSIHTVTAFLFQGLSGRPFWHSGIIAPRFIASAFAAGPAFIILVFQIAKKYGALDAGDGVVSRLRVTVTVCLLINLFLVGSELFTEFYASSEHSVFFAFLFGLHGQALLAPWMWCALGMNLAAAAILLSPFRKNQRMLGAACVLAVVGIWVEKGIGFVIPGFIPSPLGDFVEYVPTVNELLICVGIWAFGLLTYTAMLKLAIPIISGEFSSEGTPAE